MSILTLQKISKEVVYHYDCDHNNGSDLMIVFKDDLFSCVSFKFNGCYSRDQWDLLGQISEEIKRIEDSIDTIPWERTEP